MAPSRTPEQHPHFHKDTSTSGTGVVSGSGSMGVSLSSVGSGRDSECAALECLAFVGRVRVI